MRLTRLHQKLVAGIVGLFLLPGVLAAGTLVALYRWGAFSDAFTLLVTVVVGLAAMMGYLGLIAHTIGQNLVHAIRQLQLGTEVIARVNPAHRLDISSGDELQRLAEEINHLADRLETAHRDGARSAAGATAEQDADRRRLTAIVDALGDSVIVVTPAGRVSLANRAAQVLLGQCLLGDDLIVAVEDTSPITRSADRFHARASEVERFALRTRAGAMLEAVATALIEGERLAGLVIVLRRREIGLVGSTGPEAVPGPAAPVSLTRRPGPAGDASLTGPPGSVDHGSDAEPAPVGRVAGAESPQWTSHGEGRLPYDFSLFDDVDRHVAPLDRRRPLDRLVCTVLDAETTGLAPARGDRIVSLACVRVRNGVVRRAEVLDVLVNPGRPIPPESTRIHGITDAMVAGAPGIEIVAPDLLRFVDGTVLVGHEVWFDLMFLRRATDRLGVPPLTRSHPVLDTWLLSQFLHGPLGSHDLEAVAARLGVPSHGRHSARGDALMTAEILVQLFALLRRRGIGTLGETLDAMRGMRARFRAAAGPPRDRGEP